MQVSDRAGLSYVVIFVGLVVLLFLVGVLWSFTAHSSCVIGRWCHPDRYFLIDAGCAMLSYCSLEAVCGVLLDGG